MSLAIEETSSHTSVHVELTPRATLMAVAAVSFASLLLELGLTRLFSVVLFYHFAFLAISVALLGLGAGGVFSYMKREWLERRSTAAIGATACTLSSVMIFLALEVVLHLPVSLELTRWNFAKLTVVYLACAIPFFFTGLLFSVLFARQTDRTGALYAVDLLGGAGACLAIVPLLDTVGGPNTVLASALCMALAAIIWGRGNAPRTWRHASIALSALMLLLIVGNFNGKLVDIIYAKGARRDRSWVEWAKWNAISRIEVDQVGEAKYVVIDADASTAIMSADPKNWDKDIAPDNANLVQHGEQRQAAYNWKRDLMSAAPSVVNVLRPRGKYAIIGPGGGVDVLRAVANGSSDVTGIEINPLIANDVMRGKYADYSYHLYERPEVHMHVSDGRSFIRNSREQYDVIQMTLVDTWASTAAGAFALSENNLYTSQAFQEYFDHLKPGGMLAITRWEFKRPREALRVVSQEVALLVGSNGTGAAQDPAQHFMVVSDGKLDQDGRPVLVLFKKSPFEAPEVAAMAQHVCANRDLWVLYAPGAGGSFPCAEKLVTEGTQGQVLTNPHDPAGDSSDFSRLIRIAAPEHTPGNTVSRNPLLSYREFVMHDAFDISPVSDDAPFFFFTFRTRDVIANILAGTGRGMDWRINLGITVLFMVFAISIVAVLAFLLLPLWLSSHSVGAVAGGSGTLFYFVAVGLGYIFVEMALIQRFVLFLGHPTYALTVVIFLMLLASGAGSFTARRSRERAHAAVAPLLAVAAMIVAYFFLLPRLLPALVGVAFVAKLALSAVMIAPLGFVMGMPFPLGLRRMAACGDRRIEWAWAMNSAASVLGSVSAMIVAIHFGLGVTLLSAGGAYVVAALLLGRIRDTVVAA